MLMLQKVRRLEWELFCGKQDKEVNSRRWKIVET